jgi:hypothetical protein
MIGGWPRHRSIVDPCLPGKTPLLIRYYLLRSRGFGIFLHKLCRSDNARDLHDHPWTFVSVLLTGGYWEHTARGRFWRRRFSVLYRPATWAHCLELERPVWTLVIRFRERRPWGFLTARGWVGYQQYGEGCE